MAATYFPDGRYTARNARPGACLMCGASNNTEGREGLVRLHRDDDRDYQICNLCALDVGRSVGMVTSEKAHDLRTSNRSLGSKLKMAKDRVRELEDLVTDILAFKEEHEE